MPGRTRLRPPPRPRRLTAHDTWLDPLPAVPDRPPAARPPSPVVVTAAGRPGFDPGGGAADPVRPTFDGGRPVFVRGSAAPPPAADAMTAPPAVAASTFTPAAAESQQTAQFAGGVNAAFITDPLPNQAPLAAGESVTMTEDGTVTIGVLANDQDPDGDAITIADWQFDPAHGVVTREGEGQLKYTPAPDWYGVKMMYPPYAQTETFWYTVTDGVASAKATVSVRVLPANDAPAAFADADIRQAEVPSGRGDGPGYVAGNVLANDVDSDPPDTGTTTEPPPPGVGADFLTAELLTPPVYGDVHVFANGVYYYMFPSRPVGTVLRDAFTYQARDKQGLAGNPATAHVWVHYVPDGQRMSFGTADLGTTDEAAVGDDPRSGTVAPMAGGQYPSGGYEVAVLSTHPRTGRVTAFGADGTFSYRPPGTERRDEEFRYKLIAPNGLSYAVARTALPALEMSIYDGQYGAAAIAEMGETVIGAVTVANRNDTDSDGKSDDTDGRVVADEATTKGVNEIDLMRLVIKKPAAEFGGKGVVVEVEAGDAKLYNNPNAIHTGSHGKRVVYGADQFTGPGDTITLWAEARSPSPQLYDIVIVMKFGEGPGDPKETVKATAIWAEMTAFWGTGKAGIMVGEGNGEEADEYRRNAIRGVGFTWPSRDGSHPVRIG